MCLSSQFELGEEFGKIETFTMTITPKEIKNLCVEICELLKDLQIPYLLYGGMAYYLYTKDEDTEINDIDIIVSETSFEKTVNYIEDNKPLLKPIQTPCSIHINHKKLIGNDGKPFDISLDSYEHYFMKIGIDLASYDLSILNEKSIRTIPRESLIKVYEHATKVSEDKKAKKYLEKIRGLNKERNL